MSDKRKGTWRIKEAARADIDECFKTQAALLRVIDQNAKTGAKIMAGDYVKREKVKEAVTCYLEFLESWKGGHEKADSSKYYASDIDRCTEKYIKNGKVANWKDLSEELPEESASDGKTAGKDKSKK